MKFITKGFWESLEEVELNKCYTFFSNLSLTLLCPELGNIVRNIDSPFHLKSLHDGKFSSSSILKKKLGAENVFYEGVP